MALDSDTPAITVEVIKTAEVMAVEITVCFIIIEIIRAREI